MSIARKFALLLVAALLAACGGGSPEPETLSPQVMKAAAPQAATTVTLAQAAELLLNTGESGYANLFPGHKTTLTSGPFVYRYYPETGNYLGVVILGGSAYALNGVYLVGPKFGTLANPTYVGPLTNFVNVTIGTGVTTKTLRVTVTVFGQGATVDVANVPVPATQVDFCSGLNTDVNFTSLLAAYGASFTLNSASCSFNGTSASFSGTITVAPYGAVPFSVTYTWL